jgi:hypothetical protein
MQTLNDPCPCFLQGKLQAPSSLTAFDSVLAALKQQLSSLPAQTTNTFLISLR